MWLSIWIMLTVIDLLDMNANFRVEDWLRFSKYLDIKLHRTMLIPHKKA